MRAKSSAERAAERQQALLLLLELTVPLPGLERIGHKERLPRHPFRDPNIIKRDLGTAYVERRRHECGQDISEVLCVRGYVEGTLIWQRQNVTFRVNYK